MGLFTYRTIFCYETFSHLDILTLASIHLSIYINIKTQNPNKVRVQTYLEQFLQSFSHLGVPGEEHNIQKKHPCHILRFLGLGFAFCRISLDVCFSSCWKRNNEFLKPCNPFPYFKGQLCVCGPAFSLYNFKKCFSQ